ncbi:MAG: cell division protein FtsZ [Bacteroidales bacterium]|nr:cell division protein FtsZ [Bacteroidales bacterium]
MDDNNNSQFLAFDSPLNQSSYIKVVGVGGGGNNAVNHMFRKGINGVDFIVCNTDMKALNSSPVANKLPLGTSGMGAGNNPAKGRRAAEGREQEIKELFEHNTKMVFITAGMGGGTGTGAAPVIARIAKEIKIQDDDMDEEGRILVVAVVTTPFKFEGRTRLTQAMEGVEELRKHVDAILVINNEKLCSFTKLVLSNAFAMANDVLLTAVKGIAEIITLNASVNIDFRDVYTVMENSGTALMGIGEGEGENRALQAVEQATTSVLLDDNDIAGAKHVLLYFSYGPDHEVTMEEMGNITDYLCAKTGSTDTNVIWGTGVDDTLGEKVKITLIATGFDTTNPQRYELHVDEQTPPDTVAPPPTDGEPYIVQNPTPAKPTSAPTDVQDSTHTIGQGTSDIKKETSSEPNIIVLQDEKEEQQAMPRQEPAHPVDDDIRIVKRQPTTVNAPTDTVRDTPFVKPLEERPKSSPAGQPMAAYQSSIESPKVDDLEAVTMSRAERIKMLHELLRNDAGGAAKVEAMNPMKLTGERLYEAAHSSESNAKNRSVTADGKVKPNDYLFNIVD